MNTEKFFYGEREIILDGRKITFEYFLIRRFEDINAFYGIGINQKVDSKDTDYEEITDISDNYSTIRRVLFQVIEHKVSPTNLMYVVDELYEEPEIEVKDKVYLAS